MRKLSGQGPTSAPAGDAVNVFVTVRSKTGDMVRDLGIDDFTLDEAGVQQTIDSLSQAANEPLTAALLVDARASQMQSQERVRRASNTFLEKLLHAGNQALVVRFDPNLELIQGLTASRAALEAALQMEPFHSQTRPRLSEETLLYDRFVVLASEEYVRQWRPGRRVCVVLSDGVDSSSQASLSKAIEAAQRAGVSIYTIFFSDWRSRTADSHSRVSDSSAKILQRMSRETGGDFFEAGKQTIEGIYGEIETELRAAYRLSYTPRLAREGHHAIRVGVRRGDLVVLASSGHFGGSGALAHAMNLSRLSPPIARVGEVVTASGDDIGNSKVKAVYLTDGKRTFETQALEQTENTIKFKVPDGTQPGPWIEGETRPHFWNLMLRTTDGELLHYIGLKIGIQ